MTDPELLKQAGFMCIQIGPHLWHVRGDFCRGDWDKIELFPEHKLLARYDGAPVPYTDTVEMVSRYMTPFVVQTNEEKEANRIWREGLQTLTKGIEIRMRTLSPH